MTHCPRCQSVIKPGERLCPICEGREKAAIKRAKEGGHVGK